MSELLTRLAHDVDELKRQLRALMVLERQSSTDGSLGKHTQITDSRPSGTAGGSVAGVGTIVRTLNTIVKNEIGASLASNQITLPAGTYDITVVAATYAYPNSLVSRLYLYNVTTSAVVIYGMNSYTTSGATQEIGELSGTFTLAAQSVLEVRQYLSNAGNSECLGVPLSTGEAETYAVVDIWQVHQANLYACIVDQKATTTHGGTFTQEAWQKRDLQTTLADEIGMVVASDQMTLPAGTYRVRITCPAYAVNSHQARLYDATNAATLLEGSSENADASNNVANSSIIAGQITLSGTATLEVQHWCETTNADDGFGVAAASGGNEVYTVVEVWQPASVADALGSGTAGRIPQWAAGGATFEDSPIKATVTGGVATFGGAIGGNQTYTLPGATGTLALLSLAQTWTAAQAITTNGAKLSMYEDDVSTTDAMIRFTNQTGTAGVFAPWFYFKSNKTGTGYASLLSGETTQDAVTDTGEVLGFVARAAAAPVVNRKLFAWYNDTLRLMAMWPSGNLVLGNSGVQLTNGGKLQVIGAADSVQLILRANATQNQNLIELQNSAGTVQLAIAGNGRDFILDTTTGTKIGTATTQKLGFYNATPITQPTALTTQLTTITHTAPGTPDYAIQDFTQTNPWGFASQDEANTVLSVIANLQTRVGEAETKLKALGLVA